ncbi:MAG: hypothetical protein IKY73_05735, partial [Bacteroidaceae bacterium]|nr:hypothetical protein [Bacteroidaceae bacterium]
MKKMKHKIGYWLKLSALTFPLSVFVACNNDDIVPDTPEQPSVSKYEQLTFSSADEPSTRAVWADPNGSGSLVFN